MNQSQTDPLEIFEPDESELEQPQNAEEELENEEDEITIEEIEEIKEIEEIEANISEEITRFFIVGDTRGNSDRHTRIVEQMMSIAAETPHDFYLHTGDFVSRGANRREWRSFVEIEGELMAQIPILPVLGNHERYPRGVANFLSTFGLEETFHSQTIGLVHIVTLDLETHIQGHAPDEEQATWLEQQLLIGQNAPVFIVQLHQGPYGFHHSGDPTARRLLPAFADAGVDLLISGHDHLYARGLTENEIPFLISGGGSAHLYSPEERNHHEYELQTIISAYHFIDLAVTRENIQLRAIDIEGEIIDEHTFPVQDPF